MNTQDKARLYDDYVRESDRLQRENSRIKAEYVGNIPPQFEETIRVNEQKIAQLVIKLENLFK